ncbi:zwei Ig domain protein zig-8-like [Schistocerca serialis cubense]|uniref:zwei Ig domain protein zig-8-like n=1 Tax=Schistocerca serialis cubense TaxID=2023355 RepID=UPI00214F3DCD|nr:zwei Ig domain protein zig-8-like [Schistocerca serialis cubense]
MWSRSPERGLPAARRRWPASPASPWPLGVCACAFAACLCAALAVVVEPPQHEEDGGGGGGGQNASSGAAALLVAAALDDGLSDLRDLFWPLNDSWLLDGFDDFDHDHFENAGDFFPEAQSTAAPAARPPPGPPDPEFDSNLVTNVTAQLGGTAFLHCRVRNLGEHTVSWVRRRDWHILTSGLFTYTNDERFQVAHSTDEDWSLQIKYVQKRDNGTYECQVATGGGTMSHYFNLHVVAPAAFILGSGEYHIGEGSTISLVCIIENSPTPPQYVFWFHNERVVNYEGSRAVAVSTEPGPRTHSRLLIPRATRRDSGNYTCSAPDTQPDTINVYVSQGESLPPALPPSATPCSPSLIMEFGLVPT